MATFIYMCFFFRCLVFSLRSQCRVLRISILMKSWWKPLGKLDIVNQRRYKHRYNIQASDTDVITRTGMIYFQLSTFNGLLLKTNRVRVNPNSKPKPIGARYTGHHNLFDPAASQQAYFLCWLVHWTWIIFSLQSRYAPIQPTLLYSCSRSAPVQPTLFLYAGFGLTKCPEAEILMVVQLINCKVSTVKDVCCYL